MLAICLAVALIYLGAASVALSNLLIALPILGPLLALLLCGVVLTGLYWQSELRTRREMETREQEVQDMTVMVVHDLRNALAPIVLGIDTLIDNQVDTDVVSEDAWFLPVVKNASETLLTQINSILDIRNLTAKGFELSTEPVNVWHVAHAVIDQYQRVATDAGHGVELCNAAENTPLVVSGDKVLLERVFTNLVWNGIKYADKGATIYITFAASTNAEAVNISVRNPCRCIPEDEQATLFDIAPRKPARTSHRGFHSLGLGLPFCKLAVEAHGGKITLFSPIRGARDGVEIVLDLPLVNAPGTE